MRSWDSKNFMSKSPIKTAKLVCASHNNKLLLSFTCWRKSQLSNPPTDTEFNFQRAQSLQLSLLKRPHTRINVACSNTFVKRTFCLFSLLIFLTKHHIIISCSFELLTSGIRNTVLKDESRLFGKCLYLL